MARIHIVKENGYYKAFIVNHELTNDIHSSLLAEGFKPESAPFMDEEGNLVSCYKAKIVV